MLVVGCGSDGCFCLWVGARSGRELCLCVCASVGHGGWDAVCVCVCVVCSRFVQLLRLTFLVYSCTGVPA